MKLPVTLTRLRYSALVLTLVVAAATAHAQGRSGRGRGAAPEPPPDLVVEPVATNLRTVWDMLWAPDGEIWFTERSGRVSRLNLESKTVTVVGEIEVAESGESGLMGMALHPDFPGEPWVYLAHSYRADDGSIRNKLIRMRYENGRLGGTEVLLDKFLGRSNHDGSRLVVGPDRYLYMTMGEAGQTALSQDTTSLNGKILRLTLDGKPAPDNPFNNEIWSWGHRNPQGLAFQPGSNILFSSEHGPNSDDEINQIMRGRNYGWPNVRGMCEAINESSFCKEAKVVEAVHAWTPTVGIAGIDFYDHDLIPGWRGSLLATALAGRALFRIVLTDDGLRASRVDRLFTDEYGRLRDVLVGPDGSIYIGTSNHDGRARGVGPFEGDDKILRVRPRTPGINQ